MARIGRQSFRLSQSDILTNPASKRRQPKIHTFNDKKRQSIHAEQKAVHPSRARDPTDVPPLSSGPIRWRQPMGFVISGLDPESDNRTIPPHRACPGRPGRCQSHRPRPPAGVERSLGRRFGCVKFSDILTPGSLGLHCTRGRITGG